MLRDFFKERLLPYLAGALPHLLSLLPVAVLGFVLLQMLLRVARRSIKRSRLHNAAGDLIYSILRALLLLVYAILLLAALGVPTGGMVALLTAFSLAISLAVQDTFSNLAAGLTIIANKPFLEGDFVEIAGTSGVVDTITIAATKLHTPDNKVVILPNSAVTGSNIVNYSTMPTRRLELLLPVPFSTDIKAVRELLLHVLTAHAGVLADPPPTVIVAELASSAVILSARVWVRNADYWTVNFDLKESTLATLAAAGIEIPFNQLDVHVIQ